MSKREALTESQIDRRISRSPRARRANAAGAIAFVTALIAAGAFTLGLTFAWAGVVLVAAGVFVVAVVAVVVAMLRAARAIGIGRWHAFRYSMTSARRTLCAVAQVWLHA